MPIRNIKNYCCYVLFATAFLQAATAQASVTLQCARLFRSVDAGSPISRDLPSSPNRLRGQKSNRPVVVERSFRPVEKFSIVIPTYRELDNGNVARLISSVKAQRLPPGMLELVFVVNNSPAIAANPSHPIFIENQKTIQYLAKQKADFSIRVLDLSTSGIETNMGILRQRGSELAIRNSKVNLENHIIVHMDADTVFDAQFLPKLYDLYSNFPFGAVFVQRYHVLHPDADDFMLKTFYQFKLGDAHYKFIQALGYAAGGVATPQISSRASALLESGGFPPIRQDEDFVFTQRLAATQLWHYSPDIHVTAQDRARPDGFDAKIRHQWNQSFNDADLARSDVGPVFTDALDARVLRLQDEMQKQRLTPEDAIANFLKFASRLMRQELQFEMNSEGRTDLAFTLNWYAKFNAEAYALKDLMKPVYELQSAERGRYMLAVTADLVTDGESQSIFRDYNRERDEHDRLLEIRRLALRDVYLKSPIAGLSSNRYEFATDPFLRALANPASLLRRRIASLAANQNSLDRVKDSLAHEYADWMRPFDETPSRSNMLSIRLVSEYLLRGHNSPEQYPGFAKLIAEFRRSNP